MEYDFSVALLNINSIIKRPKIKAKEPISKKVRPLTNNISLYTLLKQRKAKRVTH